jgi:hypothetical protein
MNNIQTEVNFFEWFDKYYKQKILADRNENFLLQKEATHRPLTTNTFITKASPNTIITKAMTTNHAHEISNTPSLTTLITTHAHEIPTTRHMNHNTSPLNANNTNQQVTDNIDLAKKQMQTINRTTKNWLKVESKEIVHEEFPPYESIIINHRNQQLLASPMKNVSLSDETKNFEKNY